MDHGVFVIENDRLKSVLQKPSLDEMKAAGAILPSGNALTDCFFWISWRVCEQLVSLWQNSGPCMVETCCYGDFMRPLGSEPIMDYLTTVAVNVRYFSGRLLPIKCVGSIRRLDWFAQLNCEVLLEKKPKEKGLNGAKGWESPSV
ncbi:hypothetical protein GCK32_019858 [Trichostrongylus colubriformis]|uniref:GDP-fucose pyrophosphorylase domain-containing protein n=1 Tax=Trichostrongylus colubriformis TaxID=6319 RepID=A0AAN8IV08_TRICO